MRECPYCGSELPDDKNAVYCVNCDHIIDEDFLLRQKIKKELEEKRPARMKESPRLAEDAAGMITFPVRVMRRKNPMPM